MATRRNEIFRDHHTTIRNGTPPTSDPAALKPRGVTVSPEPSPAKPQPLRASAEREPRELSNAGLSGSRPEITDVARRDMIARAAYHRAEQRGFAPGEDLALDDWLAAERDVECFLAGGSPPNGISAS
jgi:hypothetical protein